MKFLGFLIFIIAWLYIAGVILVFDLLKEENAFSTENWGDTILATLVLIFWPIIVPGLVLYHWIHDSFES